MKVFLAGDFRGPLVWLAPLVTDTYGRFRDLGAGLAGCLCALVATLGADHALKPELVRATNMSVRRLWRINIALVLFGTGIASVWILLVGGFQGIEGLTQARPWHVLAMVVLTAASIALRFVRWQYLLRRVEVRLPTRPSLLIHLASLVGTATPAYLGEAVRGVFIRRQFSVPLRTSLTVLVFERLLDVVALAVVVGVVAHGWSTRAVALLVLIGVGGAAVVLRSLAHGMGVPDSTVARIRRPEVVAISLAMSLMAWLLAAFQVSVAASSFALWVAPLESVRVFTSATLFGGLTLMPAGIGSTGSIAIFQLQDVGLSLAHSVVVVSLVRLTTAGATLVVGATCLIAIFSRARLAHGVDAAVHFDVIASEYSNQFSSHVWNHLLDRKVGLIADSLPAPGAAGKGLDLGCGLGNQCLALGKRGYRVFGMDVARRLAERAHDAGASVAAGSALALPFRDNSVDFAYAVGVLHHLPDRGSQHAACLEVSRVLKPRGRFLVHETNPRNPLFRFYMGYVFPLLKKIDEGTEWWIEPERWATIPGLKLVKIQYFTFMPDFVPAWLMKPVLAIDRWLEDSRLRPYSVHYLAVLENDSSWSAAFAAAHVENAAVSVPSTVEWSAANPAR